MDEDGAIRPSRYEFAVHDSQFEVLYSPAVHGDFLRTANCELRTSCPNALIHLHGQFQQLGTFMQASRRPQRLEVQIQHEVSLMISRDLKDRRVGFVTVTGVRMSPDLRHARIFVSAMGTERQKKESLEALNHAAGWIRRELGQRVRMKFLPEINFDADTSQEYGERIDKLLDEIRES